MRNFEKENRVKIILSWYCKILSMAPQDLDENIKMAQLLGTLLSEESHLNCRLHRYSDLCGLYGIPAPLLKEEIEFELVGRGKLNPRFWGTNRNDVAMGHAGYWNLMIRNGFLGDLRKKPIIPADLKSIHDDVMDLSKKYIPSFSSENQVDPELSVSAPSNNVYQFFRSNWLPITTTIAAGITAAIVVFRKNSPVV